MSNLNKDKCAEVYSELHAIVRKYILQGYADEATEAVHFLFSSSIISLCKLNKGNLEQSMEQAFDIVADYIYEILGEENEERKRK